MAVAVKTSPGARSSGATGNVALISMVGVVYLVACLAIVFKLIPYLWWSAWSALDLAGYQFVGGTLLLLVGLAAGVGLLILGNRLLGPKPPVGVRAGVFVGFAGVILVLLLTRWASMYVEYYAFEQRYFTPLTGSIITGILGGLLLAGWLRLFTLPWTQRKIVEVDEAGWFNASVYKGNQGRMVRRGTIIGILLLAFTGIWSLMNSGYLRRGPNDWQLNIPFTGSVAVETLGDAKSFVVAIPAEMKTQVQVKWQGASKLDVGENISLARYIAAVNEVLNNESNEVPAEVREKIEGAASGDPVEYLLTINAVIHDQLDKISSGSAFHADIIKRLAELDRQIPRPQIDITKLLAAYKREAELVKKQNELGWAMKIPTAVPVVDRYALRDANTNTNPARNVRVGLNDNPDFKLKERDLVPADDFDKEVVRVYYQAAEKALRPLADKQQEEKRKEILASLKDAPDGEEFKTRVKTEMDNLPESQLKRTLATFLGRAGNKEALRPEDREPTGLYAIKIPAREKLVAASGPTHYAGLTLLPSVQFTLPLLLLVLSIWFAWRIVNMPSFADFLIATEAEMNKVSWTTQKRLVQDTIVVLVTVLLMSIFLFGTDYFWKTVLSWEPIGVLHIPKETRVKQKLEEKRW